MIIVYYGFSEGCGGSFCYWIGECSSIKEGREFIKKYVDRNYAGEVKYDEDNWCGSSNEYSLDLWDDERDCGEAVFSIIEKMDEDYV